MYVNLNYACCYYFYKICLIKLDITEYVWGNKLETISLKTQIQIRVFIRPIEKWIPGFKYYGPSYIN